MLVMDTWYEGEKVAGELGTPMELHREVYAHNFNVGAADVVSYQRRTGPAMVRLGSHEWLHGEESIYLVAPE
jgi:hypothetical protein